MSEPPRRRLVTARDSLMVSTKDLGVHLLPCQLSERDDCICHQIRTDRPDCVSFAGKYGAGCSFIEIYQYIRADMFEETVQSIIRNVNKAGEWFDIHRLNYNIDFGVELERATEDKAREIAKELFGLSRRDNA